MRVQVVLFAIVLTPPLASNASERLDVGSSSYQAEHFYASRKKKVSKPKKAPHKTKENKGKSKKTNRKRSKVKLEATPKSMQIKPGPNVIKVCSTDGTKTRYLSENLTLQGFTPCGEIKTEKHCGIGGIRQFSAPGKIPSIVKDCNSNAITITGSRKKPSE